MGANTGSAEAHSAVGCLLLGLSGMSQRTMCERSGWRLCQALMQVSAEHLWASLELVATQQAKQLQNLRAGRLWTMLACRLPRRPGICPTRHLQALGCSPRACCYCKF